MQVGGKRQLRVPPELAYGSGSAFGLPPNSALIYDVELLGVQLGNEVTAPVTHRHVLGFILAAF